MRGREKREMELYRAGYLVRVELRKYLQDKPTTNADAPDWLCTVRKRLSEFRNIGV